MISFQYVCVIRIAHCLFAILQMIQSVRMDLVITRLDEKQDIILNTLSASGSVSGARLVPMEGIKFEVRSSSGLYIQASFGSSFFFSSASWPQLHGTSYRLAICLLDCLIRFD